MPKFRFAAVDAEGMPHDGSIDAPTAAVARARLEANGLKVREVEEVEPPPGEPQPFEGPPPTYVPRDASPAPRRPGDPASGKSRSKATYFFGVASLVLTLFAIGYTLSRNPPGGRASKYDFSSPEAALRSQLKMRANGDYQAEVEYQIQLQKKELRRVADSLEVIRTADFEDKKVLFIQYLVPEAKSGNEEEMKFAEWFEKDPSSGYWVPLHEGPPGWQRKDRQLAEDIAEWQGRTK